MATHSRILAWRIPLDRGAWKAYSPWSHKELDGTEQQRMQACETYKEVFGGVSSGVLVCI